SCLSLHDALPISTATVLRHGTARLFGKQPAHEPGDRPDAIHGSAAGADRPDALRIRSRRSPSAVVDIHVVRAGATEYSPCNSPPSPSCCEPPRLPLPPLPTK